MTALLSFEIELELDGSVEPYRAATYWSPAEGGEVVDLDIRDAGVLSVADHTLPAAHPKRWVRKSFLKGVDLNNPEVRKLLDNLLELVRDDAERAIVDDETARAA